MPNSFEVAVAARRTRRSLTRAAAVFLGVLLARLDKPRSALADTEEEGSGPCFLRGTKIRTVLGYRKVEDLTVGDALPTLFGGICPIQWVSCHYFKKANPGQRWPKEAKPVRIMQSAFDENVPNSDLYLTASHALYIDGVLVPVGNLINGTTITLYHADEFERLEYFHIKLEHHDVIEAQGALCESLLEIGAADATFGDYIWKHTTPRTEATTCAPVLSFNGGRSEVKSRLRSACSFWRDRRQQLDVIRDRLEERGVALG